MREEELKGALTVVKNEYGEKLKQFLHEAVCKDDDGTESPCTTLERYETANVVLYKNYEMSPTKNVNQFPLLSSLYQKYLDNLILKINFYFPLTIAKDTNPAKIDAGIFDPLNHHKYPKTSPEKDNFIPSSIKEVATLTNVRYSTQLQNEFRSLVSKLMTDDSFMCDQKSDDTLIFWVSALRKYEAEITDDLKKVILSSAIVPMSSGM